MGDSAVSDIYYALSTALTKTRQQFPERYSIPVNVLSPVDGQERYQWKDRLSQAKNDYSGERIMLIPYLWEDQHWLGISIKFQANGQIERAEFIDPVIGSGFYPVILQEQFTEIFPDTCLYSKEMSQDKDSRNSALLTVTNLLKNSESIQRPSSMEQNEGNDLMPHPIQLKFGSDAEKIIELENRLKNGLEKWQIQNMSQLSNEMKQIEKDIERCERLGRHEEAEQERKNLAELKELLELPEQISQLKPSKTSEKPTLSRLEEDLKSGFAKWMIEDVSQLREEIQNAQKQVEKYERFGKAKEAEKEKEDLDELLKLLKLSEDIATLKSATNTEDSKLCQLEQKIKDGFAKWKIENVAQLREEIDNTRKQIDRNLRLGKTEKAEQEGEVLKELTDLLTMIDEAALMKQAVDSDESKLLKLKQKLKDGLANWKIEHVAQLLDEIENTQKQIDRNLRLGKMEDAEREKESLNELKQLLGIVDEITTAEKALNSDESKLLELEQSLRDGLAEWKIEDVSQLREEIQNAQKQVVKYERLGKAKEAEKEKEDLDELLKLLKLGEDIATLKSATNTEDSKLCQLEQKIKDGFAKWKIENVAQLREEIDNTRKQIDRNLRLGKTEKAEQEGEVLKELTDLLTMIDEAALMKQAVDSDESKLLKLKQKLKDGLANWKIEHVAQLLDEIENTQKQIDRNLRLGKMEDAEREKESLNELKQLLGIVDEITTAEKALNSDESKLLELEQSLQDGLAKWKIEDVSQLREEIQNAQKQVEKYERLGKAKEAEKEKEDLDELLKLLKLGEDIATLKSATNTEDSKLCQLEQKIKDGFAKWKIENVAQLRDEIENTQKQNDRNLRLGKMEDAEREKESLDELKALLVLTEEIAVLRSSSNSEEAKLLKLEEKLSAGLQKWKIQDAFQLPADIEQVEKQIQSYERLGKTEDVKKGRESLDELKALLKLIDEIATLKTSVYSDESKWLKLEEKLNAGLHRYKIPHPAQLPTDITQTKKQIEQYERQGKNEEAQKEREYLNELIELKMLWEEKSKLASLLHSSTVNHDAEDHEQQEKNEPGAIKNTGEMKSDSVVSSEWFLNNCDSASRKKEELEGLRADIESMPICAERSILELIENFEKKIFAGDTLGEEENSGIIWFKQLQDQLNGEELLSEGIRDQMKELYRNVKSNNWSLSVRNLAEMLKRIRPLNVQEIKRLVEKTRAAAQLIRGQEIVLFIGITGAGKSTTIQFLAGAPMKETKVEIEPGNFLEHITADGPIDNPDLRGVKASPLSKSETRFIHSVRVELKKVIGAHANGEIILCDAPGFGDTAGPEVDIANGIGVIEALKGCKSVKILALSSYKSLGDRGQGIQKLARILVNMVPRIQDRLASIFYAFTKYPETSNINALLIDIKNTSVNQDPSLSMDSGFITVLSDMIVKTTGGAEKIDPLRQHPKNLVEKLLKIEGIEYPGEVFRFSMSEETQGCIANQVQITKLSVICAIKNRDLKLVKYYLNNLKIIKDLIKLSVARDSYEDAVRSVNKSIQEYCSDVTKKFNRALLSKDGLQEEDILQYQSSFKYIENIQPLKEHLGSELVSSAIFLENVKIEMQKRSEDLQKEDLDSPSVGIYFGNLRLLKMLFKDLESDYVKSCKHFAASLEELVQSAHETIHANDFRGAAEHILTLSKCAHILKAHLEKVEVKYTDTMQFLLKYLRIFSEKISPTLARIELNENDIETVQKYVEILKSAKENPALQDRVSVYIEVCRQENHNAEKIPDLNDIYNLFIEKVVKYFEEVSVRIKERFEKNESYALEHIEKLVNNMEAIRKIPELESKTAEVYYRTVEHIRGYTQQLQKEAEQVLFNLDHHSTSINYGRLARSLLRLKNAEWINRITPGAYEFMMRHITDELAQQAQKLEDRLMKLDLSLKCPQNVAEANEIAESMESMSVLERSVPELAKYRESILQRFVKCTQGAFDRIQKTFNLQDKTVYQIKQELNELEQIKKEYDSLHPARIYLEEQGYAEIDLLNGDIVNLKARHSTELKAAAAEKNKSESQIAELNCIIQHYMSLNTSKTDSGVVERAIGTVATVFNRNNNQAISFLKEKGYSDISEVFTAVTKMQEASDGQARYIENISSEYNLSLSRFETIKQRYEQLLNSSDSISSERQMNLLREKKQESAELLQEATERKKKTIAEFVKNKQTYNFSDRLDATAANNAFLYINQCEKVSIDRVREMAADTIGFLQKYISEYANFLNSEIGTEFNHLITPNTEGVSSQSSHNLEMRLQELFTLDKFPELFKSIDGQEKVASWKQKFLDYNRSLGAKMEQYKVAGNSRELRDRLNIAQLLSCLDRFCSDVFGGNGFSALYRQYQVEITKETKEAYRAVLDYISKEDYANADIALSNIDDHPLNPRDLAQIKLDLQRSLNKLMNDTESIANWLSGRIQQEEHCKNEIKEIKENIEKIRIAVNKQTILNLLDANTKIGLQNFDKHIGQILSEMILRGLNNIESFMGADGFSEAEQGMENLGRVIRELAAYCTSKEIIEKDRELRKRLEDVVQEISKRDNFEDITKYPENPPKDLLVKLHAVASRGDARYKQAYQSMLGKIRQSFRKKIEEIRKVPLNERGARIRELNYASSFLPDELQIQTKSQIEEVHRYFTEEEKICRRDLEEVVNFVDDDDDAIRRIGTLASRYQKENQTEFLQTLREEIMRKLNIYRNNVGTHLQQQEMQLAVNIVKKIFKYRVVLNSLFSQVEDIYKSVCDLIIKAVEKCSETMANTSTIEQSSIVEKAFSNIVVCLGFSNTFDSQIQQLLSDNVLQTVNKGLHEVYMYLSESSQQFRDALVKMNITELREVMIVCKRWDELLKMIKESRMKHNLLQTCFQDMAKMVSYTDMISELEKQITDIKTQLDVELMNEQTVKFVPEREKFFAMIMKSISTLRDIETKLNDFLSSAVDVRKSEEELRTKIQTLGEQLRGIATKATKEKLTENQCDTFRKNYDHLLAIEKYIRISGISVRQYLSDSEELISEKVAHLRKEIGTPDVQTEKVAEILMNIKFLAENLSMFDKSINAQIDEILKTYKSKTGNSAVTQLTMILEQTEVGSRLISEHSALSGEDWRKRREKMQKQDDLKYALDNLDGDDIDRDVLEARFGTFTVIYHRLVNTVLSTLDQKTQTEPNLDVVISQLKLLVEKVIPNSKTVTWNQTLKDKIPELLAHIFAVWTLKHTQNYNASRGIEAAQAYLLMPHVGQVISIFRILGLGYKEFKKIGRVKIPFTGKISDDLVNNLVQIGTGEGKSVVMAVTACVFALMGVDVSCSCYSEILSMRDKADFTEVFRALDIEERIEYGTFNKLCENLLNEQCNVREKVHRMIMNNTSVVEKTETKAYIRPKVLLIDEVDVFLSEKYYGGMYIPAVYLRNPSIKALLDALWQNKMIRDLNTVKALPAYKQCASEFTNWLFLFDEAIKDMLAALKSFGSSTYIVQNDRIVYIVGESIVENVARGYDTIWAYYKENEDGNITIASLEANVGIILNCGTFSYAEMPHEYAYITGVTGTLKTLAEPEKDILRDLYEVHKNTFMPSVFGESNRNYNSTNDVHVVDASEYFTRIRGEIDVIRRAKRAILVFFESEEKLLTFYHSEKMKSIKESVQIITERVDVKERELCVKRAATEDKVTLLTRTFGRGTDFICRNQKVLANGGIHVLQTFFSQELSEEYQIMGRTARQGDQGSYRMILLDSDLEWVVGPTWKEDIPTMTGSMLYKTLNKNRNALYESKCGAKQLGIIQCKKDHEASRAFVHALSSGDMRAVQTFLLEQNRGANLVSGSARTVLLMDATGSMSSLLSATKDTVCTMFERASAVLDEKGLPTDAFFMQFTVYRNYSSRENKILEVSGWESKASNLRSFMNTIGSEGGMGAEAIEIGLWHAVKESETTDSISQVILIGDAPANSREDVQSKRTRFGEAYWLNTKFVKPTYFEDELQKLKNKEIPVHAFYLTPYAKKNFEAIAQETKGTCRSLDIHSSRGAELLTDFVTEEVLRKAAGDQGDDAVKLYRKKYVKTFYTS